MATLAYEQRSIDGVTLVHLAVETETAARVEIETGFDGPIWPPRRRGVPEAGWDGEGWTGLVEPDRPTILGFATGEPPADPPARIVETTPAATAGDEEIDPRDVVRALGRHGPPRDAVPVGNRPDGGEGQARASARDRSGGRPTSLAAVEGRLETAERLAAADSVGGAERALASEGSAGDVRRLVENLECDRERLRAAADRRRDLATRIAELDVPADLLERAR